MWQVLLAGLLLIVAPSVSAQQVDYVKRSDLWSYSMGKEAGKLGGQAAGFNGYVQGVEQQRGKLEELKQRLAQCGNCADRSRLGGEVSQLEAKLDKEEAVLCGGFMAAQEDFNPAVGAMNKLFGISSLCARMNEERTKAMAHGIYKLEKDRFAGRLKAGDVTAYNGLAMITMTTFGHLPRKERLSLACPYWFKGAELGDWTSMGQLTSQCLGASASEGERQEAFDMLKRCADRGTPYCISSLAYYYASPRQANVPASVTTNDAEALRLWDQAAAKDQAYGKREAAALRAKLAAATTTTTVEPSPEPAAEPAPSQANAAPVVAARLDRKAFRCAQMAKSVEQFRARAEARPEQWARSHERAQQDYARECAAQ